jgi:hypothetical protein
MLRFQRYTMMNDGALSGAGVHFARATDALRAIAHDSKSHTMAVGFGVKTLTVILDRQHHAAITERELDQHLASSTVFDSVTHCFLRDSVTLS